MPISTLKRAPRLPLKKKEVIKAIETNIENGAIVGGSVPIYKTIDDVTPLKKTAKNTVKKTTGKDKLKIFANYVFK